MTVCNNEDFCYISLGSDCCPAFALKELNLRLDAYPFDWLKISFDSLSRCIQDDFRLFHKNPILDQIRQVVVDEYGIEFTHDYPIEPITTYKCENNLLQPQRSIKPDYEKYIDFNVEKYGRRIERFRNVLHDPSKPLLFLYKGSYKDAVFIKQLLEKTYQREQILVIVGTKDVIDEHCPKIATVIACNPDSDGKLNCSHIWKLAIELAKSQYSVLLMKPIVIKKRFTMRIE